jgi:hypothetical protein
MCLPLNTAQERKSRFGLAETITIDPSKPVRQIGSKGQLAGKGLGNGFGSQPGHYAEYEFDTKEPAKHFEIRMRLKLPTPTHGHWLCVEVDNQAVGYEFCHETVFVTSTNALRAGRHVLRITVLGLGSGYEVNPDNLGIWHLKDHLLTLIGSRHNKNSIGHGKNVAVYAAEPPKFFYGTHELGPIFTAVAGQAIFWQPDFTVVGMVSDARQKEKPNTEITIESIQVQTFDVDWHGIMASQSGLSDPWDVRHICVTKDDVVVTKIQLQSRRQESKIYRFSVKGDCRSSFDWRSKPGGKKATQRIGDTVLLTDHNVYPNILPSGLSMAIGGTIKPKEIKTDPPGTYEITYEVDIPAEKSSTFLLACAIHPDPKTAQENLAAVLKQEDPIAENRKEWAKFYQDAIPQFECSNRTLNELYGFRWFLLRFSTAGGNLGYFKYPVVMEGRQAYQTYCCYSAPFMAFDLNWANDARYGFGHIANMLHAQYEDGRFPWYTSPRTNKVPLHHASASGLSLLPWAAWKHYLIHGDKKLLAELYPGMKKNMQWWIKDRDPHGTGLFQIDDQLETGMDDLFRWQGKEKPKRYEAIDASCYAYLNLLGVSNMARELGHKEDERYFHEYAVKTRQAINRDFWDAQAKCWKDRNPQTKQLANYICITAFYPFFAGVAGPKELSVLRDYLLNPNRFWLPYPVPALPKDHPQFNPNGFWQGPSWPAATSHVVEGFATTAKRLDRSLLPQAGELFLKAANVHMTPRADFYERYNPLTGQPLSTFRDYMHSWWIDNILRHAAGFMLEDNGSLIIDPLPLGLEYFTLKGAKWGGKKVDMLWRNPAMKEPPPSIPPGLTVLVDGKKVLEDATFKPGNKPVILEKQ